MFKKLLISAFLGITILFTGQCSGIIPSSANHASAYPRYLNGDPNFVIVYGKMGVAWYLDISSVNALIYNPPFYKLSARVVAAESAIGDEMDFYRNDGEGTVFSERNYMITYNWNSRESHISDGGDFRIVYPVGCEARTGVGSGTAEMAFAVAYNMKFFGGRQWPNPDNHNELTTAFSDVFYEGILH